MTKTARVDLVKEREHIRDTSNRMQILSYLRVDILVYVSLDLERGGIYI